MGTLIAPVSAVATTIVIEEINQAFVSGPTNHTYMYIEPDPLEFHSRGYIHANEDLDYTRYRYDSTGWESPDSSVADETNAPHYWRSFYTFPAGPFDSGALLPTFYDFTASDGSDFVLNTTLETRSFSLTFGQHSQVLAEAGIPYFGTLGISGREFVHLTVASLQDDITWNIMVIDPEGRLMTEYTGNEGDIWTLPFHPSVDGTYYVMLQAYPGTGTFALFDFYPQAIAPTPIGPGEIVTGELPTGELVMRDDTGSWVHEELAPTVHTYKVSSPGSISSVTYAYNYPQMFIGITQPPSIEFTSSAFEHTSSGPVRYTDNIAMPSTGVYYYDGSSHYVTVIGGDNIEYTLYHQADVAEVCPVNEEFQIEYYFGQTITRAYGLNLAEPSFIRVNTTASGADLDVSAFAIYEDGSRVERSLSFGTTIAGAADYYCPAGTYVIELTIDGPFNEWIEFNVGTISANISFTMERLVGVSLPTEPWHPHNLSLTLNNQDNVSVFLEMFFFDQSGQLLWANSEVLANWWDGSSLMENPFDPNNATYMISGNSFYDGFAYLSICAYQVYNNTAGLTDIYPDYPVELEVEWLDNYNNLYDDIFELDIPDSSDSVNITFGLPNLTDNYIGIDLNTTVGTWYNVSVMTGEVAAADFALYSLFDDRTHIVWALDLDDALVGSIDEFSFQFGAISDTSLLHLYVGRTPADDAFYWIEITPLTTHTIEFPEIMEAGPDLLATLGAIALPAAIGVGVIVVVYVIYVKKYKTKSL